MAQRKESCVTIRLFVQLPAGGKLIDDAMAAFYTLRDQCSFLLVQRGIELIDDPEFSMIKPENGRWWNVSAAIFTSPLPHRKIDAHLRAFTREWGEYARRWAQEMARSEPDIQYGITLSFDIPLGHILRDGRLVEFRPRGISI